MATHSSTRSLSLRAKLMGALALGLGVILLCALGGLGMAWMRLSTEVPTQVAQAKDAEKLGIEFRLQVQEWKNVLIRGADEALRTKHLKAFRESGDKVQAQGAALADGIADPKAAAIARDFLRQHQQLEAQYEEALKGFEAAGYQARSLDEAVRGKDRPPTQTLKDLADATATLADAAVNQRSQDARQLVASCAALTTIAAVLLLAVVAWWMGRAIIRPVEAVASAARAVAQGRLDVNLQVRSTDEIGVLAQAMAQVARTIADVSEAQADMARRHEAGEMSFRMDAERFPGAFGAMVTDTNSLVSAQTALIDQMLGTVQRYSIGDLSAQMPRLPGEKASITQAMDAIRENLSGMQQEIIRLVAAAADGDFSARGEAGRYQHDFRGMVEGLNRLMGDTEANLAQISGVLRALAAGDLTARMDGQARGVFARMREDANATATQLGTIVAGIQQAAAAINTAASEILSGNNDLAQRTEQQAASLEETAASMEELTVTVQQNAERAGSANALVQGAADVATRGGATTERMVATMREIDASSKQIAEIISVIDGIAFQTNILALNAAVEAARAGEQGRGFAVVASEVRQLAQRSAGAAKEIKGLIEDSAAKVTAGSALVADAGRTMADIVASVRRVTDIMADISTASQEQATGIQQVGQVVVHMDESTQQNAALVEEASAASHALSEQASALIQAVAAFRIDPAAQMGRERLAA